MVEGRYCGPFSGAFLAGRVENLVDQGAAIFVLVSQDVAGDLDQVGVQLALVPFFKHFVHLVGAHAQVFFHNLVGFANELHVAVFDAVVHHFHEMAGTAFAHPVAAGRAIFYLGRNILENIFQVRPCFFRAPGHNGGAFQCAFFAARYAGADIEQPLAFEVGRAAVGVGEVGVAAINNDVAGLQVRDQQFN